MRASRDKDKEEELEAPAKLKIWWPIKNPILSQRDEIGHFVD